MACGAYPSCCGAYLFCWATFLTPKIACRDNQPEPVRWANNNFRHKQLFGSLYDPELPQPASLTAEASPCAPSTPEVHMPSTSWDSSLPGPQIESDRLGDLGAFAHSFEDLDASSGTHLRGLEAAAVGAVVAPPSSQTTDQRTYKQHATSVPQTADSMPQGLPTRVSVAAAASREAVPASREAATRQRGAVRSSPEEAKGRRKAPVGELLRGEQRVWLVNVATVDVGVMKSRRRQLEPPGRPKLYDTIRSGDDMRRSTSPPRRIVRPSEAQSLAPISHSDLQRALSSAGR